MTDENTRASLRPSVVEVVENHPILGAILSVRRENSFNFKRMGNEWESYDKATLDCYHAVAKALAAQPRDDVRELLREYWEQSRRYIYDCDPTRREQVIARFAPRIDTALAPTTQGKTLNDLTWLNMMPRAVVAHYARQSGMRPETVKAIENGELLERKLKAEMVVEMVADLASDTRAAIIAQPDTQGTDSGLAGAYSRAVKALANAGSLQPTIGTVNLMLCDLGEDLGEVPLSDLIRTDRKAVEGVHE